MRHLSCWLVGATLLLGASGASCDEPLIPIGVNKQLLVDDFVIAESKNVVRELGQVTKANDGKPISFTRVTEDGEHVPVDIWAAYNSPYYDKDRKVFRLWHRVSLADTSRPGKDADSTVEQIGVGTDFKRGYSESTDGIHYVFKAFLEGLTTSGDTNLAVTIDEHETDPEHRYKIGYDCAGGINAAAIAHSADGIHWTPYNDGKPVTYRASDFPNQVYWDPGVNAYRLLTRTDFGDGGGPFADTVKVKLSNGKMLEVRGARSMTNPDVKADPTNWTLDRHWLFDGRERIPVDRPPIEELLKDPEYVADLEKEAKRRQLYMMTDWMYEGVHIGLLAALEYPSDLSEGTKEDFHKRHKRSIENFFIATCRDGVSWDWHWVYAGKPIVPRGPDGSWDKDMVFPPTHLVTHDDKHWIYFGGCNERHPSAEYEAWIQRQSGIGLAWLPLDRFVSLAAGDKAGEFTTKPFKLEEKGIELNIATEDDGWVNLEVLDENGQPLSEFSGDNAVKFKNVDELRAKPLWANRSDMEELVGKTVQLRFTLQDAEIYAFQITR